MILHIFFSLSLRCGVPTAVDVHYDEEDAYSSAYGSRRLAGETITSGGVAFRPLQQLKQNIHGRVFGFSSYALL
jgi:hypothetical protein